MDIYVGNKIETHTFELASKNEEAEESEPANSPTASVNTPPEQSEERGEPLAPAQTEEMEAKESESQVPAQAKASAAATPAKTSDMIGGAMKWFLERKPKSQSL